MTLLHELTKDLVNAARKEQESYESYSRLASLFSKSTAKKLLRTADRERNHAEILLSILKKHGVEPAVYPRRLRIKPLTTILRLLGPGRAHSRGQRKGSY